MLKILKKLYLLLSLRERRLSIFLLVQMICASLLGTFGVALIFPFMSLILNPESLSQQRGILFLYQLTHFNNIHDFLVFLGVFLFITLVVGNLVAALNIWTTSRFSFLRSHSLSKQVLERYLFQPYLFYLNTNSSTLAKNIVVEVRIVVQDVLLNVLRVLDQLIAALMILILLFFVNPLLSFFILAGLSGVYMCAFVLVRKKLAIISQRRTYTRDAMFKIVNESFAGIRDVKLLNQEDKMVERYSQKAKLLAQEDVITNVIGAFPRYILEIGAFGSIILVLVYFLIRSYNIFQVVPLVSLYVFAGYRLLPSLQGIFSCLTQIKANEGALDIIYNDLVLLPPTKIPLKSDKILHLNKNLVLKNVSFSYPGVDYPTLREISLTIAANTTVGFVGHTGAGKTTLIGIILGLLGLQEGQLIVDDLDIGEKNIRDWQNNLGYVPQHIYLCDTSIASNIAFGLQEEEIDMDAVKRAAAMANMSDFIEKELPCGYETIVGERGIRLSGGQIQRIGIARSLYRDPQVLILDEATSALDGITEDVILQAIKNVAHKKTIIMIAHRFSTIKECDTIFFLKNGALIDFGSYAELLERNHVFRKMAKIAK